jgi:hypothetical protein
MAWIDGAVMRMAKFVKSDAIHWSERCAMNMAMTRIWFRSDARLGTVLNETGARSLRDLLKIDR